MIVKEWMSVDLLAAYLNISRETVYRLIKRKKIPFHKIGHLYRFHKDEIDKWLKKK